MGHAIDRMLADQMPATNQAVEEAAQRGEARQAETLLDVLRPVLNFEKSDIEFWVQIAQLVVLIMILREVS